MFAMQLGNCCPGFDSRALDGQYGRVRLKQPPRRSSEILVFQISAIPHRVVWESLKPFSNRATNRLYHAITRKS